jgi:hypothetical protein
MATVQPNQGMPQQGNSGHAMGQQGLLPPGMSKEQLQQIYKVLLDSRHGASRRYDGD